MVGRKKKTKILSHEEDRISQLPDHLMCDILYHLSTKDAVRTSVLSTRWRNLWQWVPGLDLDSYNFSTFDALVSFVGRFLDSHRESWIRKLRLQVTDSSYFKSCLTRWIDVVTTSRIQHLDIYYWFDKIPLSIYTCETLVHLRLCCAFLPDSEFVSLPCLKIMHLEYILFPNETTLQKLISSSPVLENLNIIETSYGDKAIQVRCHTLKRIDIDESSKVVIDAPLLQFLRTKIYSTKKFKIINSGFPTKLDIDLRSKPLNPSGIRDILTDISRVRDLVISSNTWKVYISTFEHIYLKLFLQSFSP